MFVQSIPKLHRTRFMTNGGTTCVKLLRKATSTRGRHHVPKICIGPQLLLYTELNQLKWLYCALWSPKRDHCCSWLWFQVLPSVERKKGLNPRTAACVCNLYLILVWRSGWLNFCCLNEGDSHLQEQLKKNTTHTLTVLAYIFEFVLPNRKIQVWENLQSTGVTNQARLDGGRAGKAVWAGTKSSGDDYEAASALSTTYTTIHDEVA